MKKLMCIMLLFVLLNTAQAAEIVVNGATDVSLYVVLNDSSGDPNTGVTITDLDFFWIEQGASVESDTTITALAADNSAHADGQAIHVQSGMYRVDFPDDCFDGGIGTQVQLIVDDTGTSNRTAFLAILLSPQVDANTVSDSPPIPSSTIADVVWDEALSGHTTNGTSGDKLSDTDSNTTLIVLDTGTDGVKIGADALGAAQIANDAIATEHIATAAITADSLGPDAITEAKIADNAIAAEHIAAGAIGASELATDAIGSDEIATTGVTEIWGPNMVDIPAGAPDFDVSALISLNYLYEVMRNQTWVTATEITVYKDDASTVLMESTISDDGTTFKKTEYRAEN